MDPPWPNPAASKRKTDAARDRSTLVFWVGVAAAEVKPVYQRLKQILLRLAAVDETRAPVLDPAAGKPGHFDALAAGLRNAVARRGHVVTFSVRSLRR
jgi:hypothetical protein